MSNDPIHQFQVSKWLDLNIGGVDLSFTNASGFMLLGVAWTWRFVQGQAREGSTLIKFEGTSPE